MSQTEAFIRELVELKEGERSLFRRLAGRRLHEDTAGFDLFTGMWWPLRQKSQNAPSREASWLVAKLYCAYPIPHNPQDDRKDTASRLAALLGQRERLEHGEEHDQRRFRLRFDALLCSSFASIEPQLQWALRIIREGHGRGTIPGLDWVQLLNDLWQWERLEKRYLAEDDRELGILDIRDEWAEHFLTAANPGRGSTNFKTESQPKEEKQIHAH